ncbi:hypothetical protein HX109_10785 [Galbibacter sp. BG1]|uniref:hypothetical protein n=1 Tax=Galbibacter sp. BG1 TaxID=1170699 RepID=UPI0015BD9F45|nr:hypothetical protein [Galbibacter sp. BG1]QLE02015.1 hypothetical protein HX109_10785 [Galbibacter sp. BG1]
MKNIVLIIVIIFFGSISQLWSQNIPRYRENAYDGTFIHGVNNNGEPAQAGDPSFREMPLGISEGVYTWWNYSTSVGQPSGSYGASIGFGKGGLGSAEIWAGWTNGRLFTRFLRDCCQGWSEWNEIWTAATDGAGSGLDADTVDGLQPLLIQSTGNVGLGVSDPGNWKLAVNGNIRTKEIKVETQGWSDFVFKENYKLPTLEEVEKHIKEEGHLQDIPSAEEVEEDGIFLGEMDAKLLQKIEELMLYTIDQQKMIKKLDELNKSQSQKILELKEELYQLKERL